MILPAAESFIDINNKFIKFLNFLNFLKFLGFLGVKDHESQTVG